MTESCQDCIEASDDRRFDKLLHLLEYPPMVDLRLQDWMHKIQEEIQRLTGATNGLERISMEELKSLYVKDTFNTWRMYVKMLLSGAPTFYITKTLLDNFESLDSCQMPASIGSAIIAAFVTIRHDITRLVRDSLAKKWLNDHFAFDISDRNNPRPIFQVAEPPKKNSS